MIQPICPSRQERWRPTAFVPNPTGTGYDGSVGNPQVSKGQRVREIDVTGCGTQVYFAGAVQTNDDREHHPPHPATPFSRNTSHTRSGRIGISICVTPKCASASTTAFAMAGGAPTVADSPTPFAPNG